MRMNLTEYARHRGCYPRAVEIAVKNGRIQRDANGLIDSDQADKDWESGTSPYRSAAGAANGAAGQAIRRKLAGKADTPKPSGEPQEALRKPAASAVTSESGATDIAVYAQARAEREHYQAQMAKLSYERKLGNLIEREGVERAAKVFWSYLRDSILAIPARLAADLAAETDVARVRDLLDTELRDTFDRAAPEDELRRSYAG